MKSLAVNIDDFYRMIMELNCEILDPSNMPSEDAAVTEAISTMKVLEIVRSVFENSMDVTIVDIVV